MLFQGEQLERVSTSFVLIFGSQKAGMHVIQCVEERKSKFKVYSVTDISELPVQWHSQTVSIHVYVCIYGIQNAMKQALLIKVGQKTLQDVQTEDL